MPKFYIATTPPAGLQYDRLFGGSFLAAISVTSQPNLFLTHPPDARVPSSIMAQISPNKVVTITYDLSVTDENQEKVLVESAEEDAPMVFLFGQSGLPEEFENQLNGKQAGDTFNFSLTPEQAYGDYDQQAVVDIPKNVFEIDGKIDDEMVQVGNFLPMADNQGHHMQGKIVDIGADTVKMDFNHPLAGMVMHFDGKVADVREATREELDHGHVHGEGGHHH
ncbi:FKBP-type peptidyl-prolyl cis-trans isomerase [Hymenobacter fodinae]|nr:FKBP-type peptidyl-prolyl cis-trans isomerase [Hymenobacter fodinae]